MKTNDTTNCTSDSLEATMNITVLGKEMKFCYSNNEFMKNVIIGIFKGNDYPILRLPNYTPKRIIDVGANIGATAIYFLSHFPNAEIFCYEPSLRNYMYLQKNTKHFSNIKNFQYGLNNESIQIELFHGKDQPAQDSIIMSKETAENSEVVNLVKASEEIAKKGIKEISILKIDTEGCEVPILSEFQLLENANIDMIYIEYHSEDDRLTIDRLLSSDFLLFHSSANAVHRGTNGYISKDLCKKHHEIEWLKK